VIYCLSRLPKETAADYQAESAWREVEAGNREKARAEANAALKLAPNRPVPVYLVSLNITALIDTWQVVE